MSKAVEVPTQTSNGNHDNTGNTKPGNNAAASQGTSVSYQPTPMMAQFLEIKAANPDCLLFYRMGDFYELFFEDAEIASRALGITLTKRGKHHGRDIAMCGVPYHASDQYLQRLIKLGHRVAVCEQTESPVEAKKRGPKSVVRREVVRLVTPGTLTEDNLLDAKQHNFLTCLVRIRSSDEMAISWVDISTGEFSVTSTDPAKLPSELARLAPKEIIFPESLLAEPVINEALLDSGVALAPLPASRFESAVGERSLKQHFNVAALEAFGDFTRAEISACGGLVEYILLTQVGKMPNIQRPHKLTSGHAMLIDVATRTNLELTKTLSGERKGSLLATIDFTITGPGGRLLAEHLSSPLAVSERVNLRLDAVDFFYRSETMRQDVRTNLKDCPDLGRALARLTLDRGSPQDLANIARGIASCKALASILAKTEPLDETPKLIDAIAGILAMDDEGLVKQLQDALDEDLPGMTRDGGFIRSGYADDLDENRRLRDESKQIIAGLQKQYAEKSNIKTLKIKHNNVLGYFVEVTAQYGNILMSEPMTETFIHRQTLANAVRFTTTELGELEQKIQSAAVKSVAIELEIFTELVKAVVAHGHNISKRAASVAGLDVFAALAELAVTRRYNRPVVDDTLTFEIKAGRHPVVEAALRKDGESQFIANSCNLSGNYEETEKAIWLLTGPNMAGKSTFLRQNALIALLAQMGSFVPAEKAHIGIVDRLFSRVGAADDLARGRSTFMVEMVETATILNQASGRSLVILDEIGRGTATFDGLSIAWGCVEYLHEVNKCRALFATHFHELTALSAKLARIGNATMKVREWKGDVVFLHEVGPGAADRSYGIQVAKLAGLPEAVIERASDVLSALEEQRSQTDRTQAIDDLPLFSAPRPVSTGAKSAKSNAAMENLAEIFPDEMTPREALDALYKLKLLLTESQTS